MVTAALPTQFTLSTQQLQSMSPDGALKQTQLQWRQLQQQTVFINLGTRLKTVFQLAEEASQCSTELTVQQKTALIQAWNDYCAAMLDFILYLKEMMETHGKPSTAALGQACLRHLIQPYMRQIERQVLGLVDDSDITLQGLILTPSQSEQHGFVAFASLLKALEKYYRANRQWIQQLDIYASLAKKLSRYDFSLPGPSARAENLRQFQETLHAFIKTHQDLRTSKAQLTQQITKLEKRFSLFLIGPIFKFFLRQQHQLCQMVMTTITQRIQSIGEEVAHQISAKGSRYLSFLAKNANDPWCGKTVHCVNHALIDLEQQMVTPEITTAKIQLQQSSQHFIDYQAQSRTIAGTSTAYCVAASLQTLLSFSRDYRTELQQCKEKVENTAKKIITGCQIKNETDCNQYFWQFVPKRQAKTYRFQYAVLQTLQNWSAIDRDSPLQTGDITTPHAHSLSATFTHTLYHTQLLRQPIEKLVVLRHFADNQQVAELNTRLDAYLTNYQQFSCPQEDSERQLEILLRIGSPTQRASLREFFKSWNDHTLYTLANNKPALEAALSTLHHVTQYTTHAEDRELNAHCTELLDQFAHMTLQALREQQDLDLQTRQRLINLLSVCMSPPLQSYCYTRLYEAFSGSSVWYQNKIQFNHDAWSYIKPMAYILQNIPQEDAPHFAPLVEWYQQFSQRCHQHLTQLTEQKAWSAIDSLDSVCYSELQTLLTWTQRQDFTAMYSGETPARYALPGHYLYRALLKRWALLMDPQQQDVDKVTAALTDCLDYINELVKQREDSTREFIYPQAPSVIQLLQQMVLVLQEEAWASAPQCAQAQQTQQRIIQFLSAAAETRRHPHLEPLVYWKQTLAQYQHALQEQHRIKRCIEKLERCYSGLPGRNPSDSADQNRSDDADSADRTLIYDADFTAVLREGLLSSSTSQYHQAAQQVMQTLLNVAFHYFAEYEQDPRVDRWPKADCLQLQCIMRYLAELHTIRTELAMPILSTTLEKLYDHCQAVSQKECLVALFNDILPDPWRAHWKPFLTYDALDRRTQRLDQHSPLRQNEKAIAKQLMDQLVYLLEGKGAGRFIDLRRWRHLDETLLYQTLQQVTTISDQRRRLSHDYVSELQILQSYCSQPPAIDVAYTAKTNSAQHVADTIDYTLDQWVEKICEKTLDNFNQLSEYGESFIPPHNNEVMRLFGQRLCFIYTLHFHYQDPGHPVRRYLTKSFIDVLNMRAQSHPEKIINCLQKLPPTLLNKLLTTSANKPVTNVGEFWKLVIFVDKRHCADQVSSTIGMRQKIRGVAGPRHF